MPFVNIKTLRGALSNQQKHELHKKIADVIVAIEGGDNERFRPYVMIMIEELEPQNASIGGRQADEKFIQQMAHK